MRVTGAQCAISDAAACKANASHWDIRHCCLREEHCRRESATSIDSAPNPELIVRCTKVRDKLSIALGGVSAVINPA